MKPITSSNSGGNRARLLMKNSGGKGVIRQRGSNVSQVPESLQTISIHSIVDKASMSTKTSFSSLAISTCDDQVHDNIHEHLDELGNSKHCATCTCEDGQHHHTTIVQIPDPLEREKPSHICQDLCHDDYLNNNLPLPPPLPEPNYSYHRRIMPPSLIQLSSPKGRLMFQESLASGMGNSFFPLSEQFLSQSEPAYCGVTTLIMVLNAIGIDPNVRWKGGWRWYGSEEMILDSCCINPERVNRVGILMEEFYGLARCQGLRVDMKRPHLPENPITSDVDVEQEGNADTYYSLEDFRKDIITSAQNPPAYSSEEDGNKADGCFMVVSFSRFSLGQTGDGHFSPVAAYSEETDRCLILDVARFKYPPYWVSVEDLYKSLCPKDSVTNMSRGWFMLHPPTAEGEKFKGTKTVDEGMRPSDIVPLASERVHICPVGDIKVKYCPSNNISPEESNEGTR